MRRSKIVEVLTFSLSLVGLILASFIIGEGGERLSRSLGHSFAGGVILGLVTALPETVLVLSALAVGVSQAAYSSITGANSMLMTLGTGLLGLVYFGLYKRPIAMKGRYSREVNALLATSLITIVYLVLRPLTGADAFRFLIGSVLITVYVYYVISSHSETRRGKEKVDLLGLAMVLAGGSVVVVLSPEFLESLEAVSKELNIPYPLMVYFLTPIAAELEEKLSAYLMILKSSDNGSLALYSFVGSKLENASLLLGLTLLFAGTSDSLYLAVLALSNLFGVSVLRDGKLTLLESILGLCLYVLFSFVLAFYSGTSLP